jgi:hypothetical protein
MFLGYLELPLARHHLLCADAPQPDRRPVSSAPSSAWPRTPSPSSNPLGMYGIVKTLVGYFAASVGLRIDVEHSVDPPHADVLLLLLPSSSCTGCSSRGLLGMQPHSF